MPWAPVEVGIRFWEIPYAFGMASGALAIAIVLALILAIPTLAGLALVLFGVVLLGKGLVALSASTDPRDLRSRYYSTVNPFAWNAAAAALFVFGAIVLVLDVVLVI